MVVFKAFTETQWCLKPHSSWGGSVNRSGSSTLLHLLILSQKAVKINHSLVAVIALNHLVGQQDAGDGLSVGQHGFVVQVLFPVATAEETGWAGDVKHHDAAHRALVVDPGHGNETLLTWKEGQVHNVVHPSEHGDLLSARPLWNVFVPAMSHSCSRTFSLSDHCSTFTENSTRETQRFKRQRKRNWKRGTEVNKGEVREMKTVVRTEIFRKLNMGTNSAFTSVSNELWILKSLFNVLIACNITCSPCNTCFNLRNVPQGQRMMCEHIEYNKSESMKRRMSESERKRGRRRSEIIWSVFRRLVTLWRNKVFSHSKIFTHTIQTDKPQRPYLQLSSCTSGWIVRWRSDAQRKICRRFRHRRPGFSAGARSSFSSVRRQHVPAAQSPCQACDLRDKVVQSPALLGPFCASADSTFTTFQAQSTLLTPEWKSQSCFFTLCLLITEPELFKLLWSARFATKRGSYQMP